MFGGLVEVLLGEWEAVLEERLREVTGLAAGEREVVVESARRRLSGAVGARLQRLLLVELRAASLGGALGGADPEERWTAFLDAAATPRFRAGLAERYPGLRRRLDTGARNWAAAVAALAERLAADRSAFPGLADGEPRELGELRGLELGLGDPHRGGHTVARLDFAGGSVMYKPRPMEVDAALDAVLAGLFTAPDRIRTPRVLARAGYGWTGFVEHEYCQDDARTAVFYRNLGRWLAVMRLVGGTDLHGGNIIAAGPVPVVIDAETMFSPTPSGGPTGASAEQVAERVAERLLSRAVPRVGILPMRVGVLSGVDLSAAGRLPSQQPLVRVPAMVGAGTDEARLVERAGWLPPSKNHPVAVPDPERFWEEMVAGFAETGAHLRALDRAGRLLGLLEPFAGCEVRQVLRSTQVYGDVGHMLWHPVALHDETAALDHARTALRRHAQANPVAPADAAVVETEIADLLVGDTPVFTTRLSRERLHAAVDDWRAADLDFEAGLIRFALPGVYADGHRPVADPGPADRPEPPAAVPAADRSHRRSGVERRRRELAARAVRALRDSAVRGADGSATWVGPVLTGAGWAVRELDAELGTGQAGVVLALAGYAAEAADGRADPVPGLDELLRGALEVLYRLDRRPARGPGALDGAGGRIWTWLTLADLLARTPSADSAAPRVRALVAARGLRNRVAGGSGWWDGVSGVVVPLLDLGAATGDPAWTTLATDVGRSLVLALDANPLGLEPAGFARGGAGTAWALDRLAAAGVGTGEQRDGWRERAGRLSRSAQDAWTAGGDPGWCRGAAGAGLAACDLYRRTADDRLLAVLRRTTAAVAAGGLPGGRSLCHGAPGAWELLTAAGRATGAAEALSGRRELDTRLLDVLAAAPRPGFDAAEATAPGLLNGLSGAVVTLLRMHPESAVASPLLQQTRCGR
ncbi:type 2 lanthipeptide synthetase LanM family protein [Streptacidiphilus sp. P02-A3a]|uniref:type 2 lanthipeptide synthetase LanM family protein n=1 Tax=Streptacidiphilus sp. P02-A3a TaxID=2704468 RepID=UPI0015FBA609|nr:type 2 lanthipeptide synthetase LanM family protein [Streptacidiphilus sp. P02-A3a]QMU71459.1 type 2 lantipeptide synthetase LanM [Streptacidiphilus sp. P02-A3a]